jgi:hypothetical protein
MSNDKWGVVSRNPQGRGCFFVQRRYQSLVWNDQTALLLPCWTKK